MVAAGSEAGRFHKHAKVARLFKSLARRANGGAEVGDQRTNRLSAFFRNPAGKKEPRGMYHSKTQSPSSAIPEQGDRVAAIRNEAWR